MEGNEWLAVATGGALGGALRYWVTLITTRFAGQGFPWGTLVVNTLGSLLIGLLAGTLDSDGAATSASLLLIVGFCGSFTTVSSWALQSLELHENARPLAMMGNLLLTLLLGLSAAVLGLSITGGLIW